MQCNLQLNLHYIPSKDNPSDCPSHALSDLDCTLAPATWRKIQQAFGPHTVDLMAPPANVMPDQSGNPLKFFSPFPTVQVAGANVFSQTITLENCMLSPHLCWSVDTSNFCKPKVAHFLSWYQILHLGDTAGRYYKVVVLLHFCWVKKAFLVFALS